MMFLRHAVFVLFAIIVATMSIAQSSHNDDDKEGGVIGTGISGTVTALGSIRVNDLVVEFDPELELQSASLGMSAVDLRPGHVVAVVAEYVDEVWRAHSIRQVHALIGPVEALADDHLVVLSTRVELTAPIGALTVGDWVAVSGMWQGDLVLASRVDPTSPGIAQISGSYFGAPDTQPARIGGTQLFDLDDVGEPGAFLTAEGDPVPGGLTVRRRDPGLLDPKVDLVLVEGYFSQPRPDGLYTVLGSGLVAFTDQPEMIDTTVRTIICGRDGQLLSAAEVEMLSAQNPIVRQLGCR